MDLIKSNAINIIVSILLYMPIIYITEVYLLNLLWLVLAHVWFCVYLFVHHLHTLHNHPQFALSHGNYASIQ